MRGGTGHESHELHHEIRMGTHERPKCLDKRREITLRRH
jgi:hypothetical protein